MTILPSDHIINDEQQFLKILRFANEQAEKEKSLITLGIKPDQPHTGYGYIQCNTKDTNGSSIQNYPVKKFVEKPNLEKAKEYFAEGNFFWNAGMFVWRTDTILEELKKFVPNIYDLLKPLESVEYKEEQAFLDENFKRVESISVDYAIMEKSQSVECVPADFGWNDIGSWSALSDVLPKVNENYPICQELFQQDAEGNIVHSPDQKVALLGIKDLVVVNTEGTLMICPKERAQEIKVFPQTLIK